MIQLKLQKKILMGKIEDRDMKLERLTSILHKKSLPDFYSTEVMGAQLTDFRMPQRANKVVHDNQTIKRDILPQVCGEQLTTIRQRHIQRTTCKREIARLLKDKEDEEAEKEKKNAPRKFPSISIPESLLPNRYLRGELPCTIEHGVNGKYLSWACPLENLDYEYYLPIFFDGLQCSKQPVCFIARQGIEDMLFASRGHPERIISCIKSLIRPLRNALSKFDPDTLLGVCKAIQQLVKCNVGVGEALLPHSKQFLAPLGSFLDMQKNIGDSIDYGQRNNNDVGEEVRITLETLEERGGPTAFRQIKFSIPLYESCVRPPDFHHQKAASSGAVGGGGAGGRHK